MSHYVDFNACFFFVDTFQPMNSAMTFQIGLNDCARAIKITFACAWESFQWIRTKYIAIYRDTVKKYHNTFFLYCDTPSKHDIFALG